MKFIKGIHNNAHKPSYRLKPSCCLSKYNKIQTKILLKLRHKIKRSMKNYGTGSKPPLWNGLQRKIRLMARKLPLIAPYLSNASTAY
jgi:hypothetical protein